MTIGQITPSVGEEAKEFPDFTGNLGKVYERSILKNCIAGKVTEDDHADSMKDTR